MNTVPKIDDAPAQETPENAKPCPWWCAPAECEAANDPEWGEHLSAAAGVEIPNRGEFLSVRIVELPGGKGPHVEIDLWGPEFDEEPDTRITIPASLGREVLKLLGGWCRSVVWPGLPLGQGVVAPVVGLIAGSSLLVRRRVLGAVGVNLVL